MLFGSPLKRSIFALIHWNAIMISFTAWLPAQSFILRFRKPTDKSNEIPSEEKRLSSRYSYGST